VGPAWIKQAAYPNMQYLNRNHIVELYFKDRDRHIFITGENIIRYKEVKYVQPPDTLYFGTLLKLAERMTQNGIRSSTKGYVKLYGTKVLAEEFASKFKTDESDHIVVLSVDAKKAFSEGLKFSTYKEDEYVVVRVDKKYILEAS
jgi:RNA:NAD 2'-phosphotransferase (TPT1/KptA family)